MKRDIYNGIKVGDIVTNKKIWGDKKFEVKKLTGNDYLPELFVKELYKPDTVGNYCNFNVRCTQLYDSCNRPFKRLNKKILHKLILKKNTEAKREFLIRIRHGNV